MKVISVSIDLNKIDRTRIVEGKNGAKYYNITVICNDTKDQYGNDVAVTIGQTKEERAAKTKAVYLGNGRTVYSSDTPTQEPPTFKANNIDNDDLPW